jgi:hypothetical protein
VFATLATEGLAEAPWNDPAPNVSRGHPPALTAMRPGVAPQASEPLRGGVARAGPTPLLPPRGAFWERAGNPGLRGQRTA